MRHATRDMWHATCDMWHATCDMWHATCEFLFQKNSAHWKFSPYKFGPYREKDRWSRMDGWTDWQINRQTERQTHIQRDTHADRHTQADTQTHRHDRFYRWATKLIICPGIGQQYAVCWGACKDEGLIIKACTHVKGHKIKVTRSKVIRSRPKVKCQKAKCQIY